MNSKQFIASVIVLLVGLLMWLFQTAYFAEQRARNDALFFAAAFPAPSEPSGSAENTRPKNTHAGDSFEKGNIQ